MATLKQKRTELLAAAESIAKAAQRDGRSFTDEEASMVDRLLKQVDEVDAQLKAGNDSDALLRRLTGHGTGHDGSQDDNPAGSTKGGRGSSYAKSAVTKLHSTPGLSAKQALFSGGIETDAPVGVNLPAAPHRLLDLIPRDYFTEGNLYEYLRQVLRENNAAVVPDGEPKPVSRFEWEEVEEKYRVIAHLSESFPVRYVDDYDQLLQIVGTQMQEGILEALEAQVAAGDGLGDNFTGLLTVTGTQAQAFETDVVTTLRKARTKLEDVGQVVTGVVMHPSDIEALDLMREDGATGGFLVQGNDFYQRIFGRIDGQAPPVVGSRQIPAGQALLGDFRQTLLRVRQAGHTLRGEQGTSEDGKDMFSHNLMRLRSEGRFGFDILRPAAFAFADLTGV